jgi:hypothetical protein
VLGEVADQVEGEGLDSDMVRQVLLSAILGEQPLPLNARS